MRLDLVGLSLSEAEAILAEEGIVPRISRTEAPRRKEPASRAERVVYASDDGSELIIGLFTEQIMSNK